MNQLKVVFVPNYRVSLAEKIIPAADLSEQISLAGTEASGTGNMKLQLNGALTIGTLDGANVEILEEVGEGEHLHLRAESGGGRAAPRLATTLGSICEQDEEIRRALDLIESNFFSMLEPGIFDPILRSLLDYGDHYMLLADLRDYIETQARVDAAYRDREGWSRKAILNVARAGKFSSDRTITEYASEIWHVGPVNIPNGA